MTKTVCDICGKECSDRSKFIMPVIEEKCGTNYEGEKIKVFYAPELTGVDLCPTCQTIIAHFLRGLKENNGVPR